MFQSMLDYFLNLVFAVTASPSYRPTPGRLASTAPLDTPVSGSGDADPWAPIYGQVRHLATQRARVKSQRVPD